MAKSILITGMHRSGTSAVTGALKLLGVELGNRLMPGRAGENEHGFFEHLDVYDLHNRLLVESGYSWHDLRRIGDAELETTGPAGIRQSLLEVVGRDFGEAELWGVKDPRMCRLLPIWWRLLEEVECEPLVLFVYRHPAEVAGSLARRNGFSLEKSAFLWCDHNLVAERECRGKKRVFLSYESLLADPVEALEAVAKVLGLEWPRAPREAAHELTDFVSDRLRHHKSEGGVGPEFGRPAEAVRALWQSLTASNLASGGAHEGFDEAETAYQRAFAQLDPLLLEQASGAPRYEEAVSHLQRQLDERTLWMRSQESEIRQLSQWVDGQQEKLVELNRAVGGSAEAPTGLESLAERVTGLRLELGNQLEEGRKLRERVDQGAERHERIHRSMLRLEAQLDGMVEHLAELARSADRRAEDLPTQVGRLLADQLPVLRAELNHETEALRDELEEIHAKLEGKIDTAVEELTAAVASRSDVSTWQTDSLIQLREDLEGVAAVVQERLARAPGERSASESALRHSDLAEMMWTSRPWQTYLWFGRMRRAVAAKLNSNGRSKPSRVGPAAVRSRQPDDAAVAVDSDYRALIIDHRLPTPDQDSGSVRMSFLIDVVRDLGFHVDFLPHNLHSMEPYAGRLRERGVGVICSPQVKSVEDYLRRAGSLYDLVFVCRASIAEDCADLVREHCAEAKFIFDTVDLQYLREERQAELEQSPSLLESARRTKEVELRVARMADATLVVSPYEERVLADEVPEVPVSIVSNIHVVHGRKAEFSEREGMMFIGGFEHPPNVDAVEWLVNEIMPDVWRELPDVELLLVGSKPPKAVHKLASERVRVTGFVPDVEPFFTSCRLSVAPLRYGAGVKGKVNQSLSYGLPCVMTGVAAEGMALVDGEEALIADDPSEFAASVVRLYSDEELWYRLSEAGLENTRANFSIDAARLGMLETLRRIDHPRAEAASNEGSAERTTSA